MTSKSLSDCLEELQRRARRGMALGLERIRAALAELGSPERGLAVAHVAGSNGKGSTCAMVEAVARAAGLRTGLYTSPHLCRVAERIRVDGEPIDDEALARALAPSLAAATGELTFFEVLTAAAFVAFREACVDLAMLEVGLGGRFDATNVVYATNVTAITSIALEHTDVLGTSLGAIAREKAGILKPGVPVMLGPLEPEADEAIAAVAAGLGAGPIWRVAGKRRAEGEVISVWRDGDAVAIVPPMSRGGVTVRAVPALRGAHQADNAAVAAGIAWRLSERWPAIADAIGAGLTQVRWPGRLERIEAKGRPSVLLDCAHNAHGALALARALLEDGATEKRTSLVFGALVDKDWKPMLSTLAPLAGRRYYAAPKGRAAVPPEALAAMFPGAIVPDPSDAIARALREAAPGETVLVTGSGYLVGEVRGKLLGIECDPIIAL